jgi:hypothetical protein
MLRGAKYSTTTEYAFTRNTLPADQQLASGVAREAHRSGNIHADHLGSTNVVSDSSGRSSETGDYSDVQMLTSYAD